MSTLKLRAEKIRQNLSLSALCDLVDMVIDDVEKLKLSDVKSSIPGKLDNGEPLTRELPKCSSAKPVAKKTK